MRSIFFSLKNSITNVSGLYQTNTIIRLMTTFYPITITNKRNNIAKFLIFPITLHNKFSWILSLRSE